MKRKMTPERMDSIASALWSATQEYRLGPNWHSKVDEPNFADIPERERLEWLMMVQVVLDANDDD